MWEEEGMMIRKVFHLTSGSIILSALWILVFLSLIAFSLAAKSQAEIQWARYATEKTKSKYLSWQGVVLGLREIYHPNNFYENLGASKSISYSIKDEEGKLNLNAFNLININVLLCFLEQCGVEEETSKIIAFSLIDWIDIDETPSHQIYGAENSYYQALSQPGICKNLPFDSKEELLLVRGMTPEIFQKIKNHITLWPQQGSLKINPDTASEIILRSFARSLTRNLARSTIADADTLVGKIIEYRLKNEKNSFENSEQHINIAQLDLNPQEKSLMLSLQPYWTKNSNYFSISSYGVTLLGAKTFIETVISKEDFFIVSWRRK